MKGFQPIGSYLRLLLQSHRVWCPRYDCGGVRQCVWVDTGEEGTEGAAQAHGDGRPACGWRVYRCLPARVRGGWPAGVGAGSCAWSGGDGVGATHGLDEAAATMLARGRAAAATHARRGVLSWRWRGCPRPRQWQPVRGAWSALEGNEEAGSLRVANGGRSESSGGGAAPGEGPASCRWERRGEGLVEGQRLRRRIGLLLLARLAPARLLVTATSQEAPAWDLVLRGRRGLDTPRRFAGDLENGRQRRGIRRR